MTFRRDEFEVGTIVMAQPVAGRVPAWAASRRLLVQGWNPGSLHWVEHIGGGHFDQRDGSPTVG